MRQLVCQRENIVEQRRQPLDPRAQMSKFFALLRCERPGSPPCNLLALDRQKIPLLAVDLARPGQGGVVKHMGSRPAPGQSVEGSLYLFNLRAGEIKNDRQRSDRLPGRCLRFVRVHEARFPVGRLLMALHRSSAARRGPKARL
ncbi:hypothetical protein CBM2633_P380028 [Cupriavidus taiwanensis]|uniref:Uncharacterized protein n=2 Tax=Cupriavidus TaxID=106589 RepID=A0A375HWY6_9BURK|nr:hypothetical protein CBM2585_P380027 [Cupriavidus taiwanensis]SOZ40708.1 hypothetical protein CBM2605_P380029 [Cupriavidus neocaledonicus]SOY76628.1 hypothetical protein CBM2588_P420029 [Cupriavidus taiwanensis]SOY76681.1 hypothetical protein CBM2592_P400026 [Cupriavidus taiwanensis]SOY76986.1 hypothetical protein CBM2589_P380027 [Cupriavidus taiwanensis]